MEESCCEGIQNKTNDGTTIEAADYFSLGAVGIWNHTVEGFLFVLFLFCVFLFFFFFYCVFSEAIGKCPRNDIKTNNLCHTNH